MPLDLIDLLHAICTNIYFPPLHRMCELLYHSALFRRPTVQCRTPCVSKKGEDTHHVMLYKLFIFRLGRLKIKTLMSYFDCYHGKLRWQALCIRLKVPTTLNNMFLFRILWIVMFLVGIYLFNVMFWKSWELVKKKVQY